MAKKKKPIAKGNRGFATTSTPSKKVEASDSADAAEDPAPQHVPAPTPAAGGEPAGAESALKGEPVGSTQDVELQQLSERLSAKARKEVSRLWKAIEYDQRMAQSLTTCQVDPGVCQYLQADVAGSSKDAGNVAQSSASSTDTGCRAAKPLPASLLDQDKLYLRALTTYGLLQQLGFTSAQAEQALGSTSGFYDLEECIDELIANLTVDELQEVEKRQIELSASDHQNPGDASDESIPPKHSAYSFDRTLAAKGSLPSQVKSHSKKAAAQTAAAAANVSEAEVAELTAKLREAGLSATTLVRDVEEQVSLGQEGSGALDTLMKPSLAWATARVTQIKLDRLKGQQKKLIRGGAQQSAAFDVIRLDSCASRLAEVVRDAQQARDFDPGTAAELLGDLKEQWESQLKDEQEEQLAGQSQAETEQTSPVPDQQSEDVPLPAQAAPEQEKETPEAEEDGMFGGMLDEAPSQITDSATGDTIHVRSFPNALKSGKSPRSLLTESLRRLDSAAHLRFENVQTGGRVCRSRLTMRWSGPSGKKSTQSYVDVFQLTGEGTESQVLAEEMLATLALNCVDRDRPAFRSLAGPFRDWYEEVEIKRKAHQESQDIEIIRRISKIIASRLDEIAERRALAKQTGLATAADSTSQSATPSQTHLESLAQHATVRALDADAAAQLQSRFAERCESPSYQKMTAQRQSLPIFKYREHILDVMNNNQIFVLSGETGCGKSTQVPAYILEDCLSRGKECKIYCTEPRRISAISLAERVSQELGEQKGLIGTDQSLVGYSIRLDSHVGREARLIYATSGILLRMMEGTSVNEVTHIIIDEVHERSIESDFLLIILRTLLAHRKDLKVILMSATLDAERISAYCGGCPTVSVPGRTFPVQINYLEDAIEATDYTLEDNSPYAVRLQRDKHGRKMDVPGNKARLQSTEDDDLASDDDDAIDGNSDGPRNGEIALAKASLKGQRYSPKTITTLDRLDERVINHDLIVALLERVCFSPEFEQFSAATLVFLPGIQDIRKLHDMLLSHKVFGSEAFIVSPLHSTLSSEEQSAVFNIPPHGVRKIVISTNIAETGVTIPDVTCVIDSGKHREMRFDEKRQTSRLVDCFVAKSNAKQRRGRAGRVQEGLCFHLFTKFRHDHQLAEHPLPEMLRLSLQDLALKLKIMKVRIGNSIGEALSQALDPPTPVNVTRAVSALVEVKALTTTEDITPLGRHLARIPLDVHMGKFLLIATLFKCLDAALTIAAALNSKSPFLTPFGREAEADAAKASFKVGHSDFLTIANAFNSWRRAVKQNHHMVFCRKSFLSHQSLQQMEELRQQYMAFLLDSGFVKVDDETRRAIVNIRYRGGRGVRLMETPRALDENGNSIAALHAALSAGLYPKLLSIDPRSGQLRTLGNNQPASIHPSSVNFRLKLASGNGHPAALPEGCHHLAYFNIVQSRKLYARETAPVSDLALILFCGDTDFRFSCKSVYLDRNRVRWRISGSKRAEGRDAAAEKGGGGKDTSSVDALIALRSLRALRERISALITTSFRSPGKAWSEEDRVALDVALRGLGAFANDADRLDKGASQAT
ncbi:unnamed protein product [Parajaminaea phylloscopi]